MILLSVGLSVCVGLSVGLISSVCSSGAEFITKFRADKAADEFSTELLSGQLAAGGGLWSRAGGKGEGKGKEKKTKTKRCICNVSRCEAMRFARCCCNAVELRRGQTTS